MTADLIAWLRAQLDEDERIATDAAGVWKAGRWRYEVTSGAFHTVVNEGGYSVAGHYDAVASPWYTCPHVARHDPAAVLADVAAKRAILDEVASWGHTYVDGDGYYSCGLSEEPGSGAGAGSGCADDDRRGTCDCGLEARQSRIVGPLATAYSDRDGYREEWRP